MRFFYSLSVRLYSFAIRLAAISGNRKAGLWIGGRKAQKQIFRTKHTEDKWLWFHVSSLGEFEQGRPLIEYYKSNHAGYKILLTFFSPSGFEIRKNYKEADLVLYLPADTICNARRLVKNFNVKAAFFVKYDFWFNYLHQLKKANIPLYLISGIFRQKQHFFKWYGKWQCRQLRAFTHFFVQNENSATLLKKAGFSNVTISGDTRFDRVVKIANEAKTFKEIEQFIQQKQVYMAGSSWEPDEKFIIDLIKQYPDIKFIIVPHETDEDRIRNLQQQLPCKSSLYTDKNLPDFANNRILIINTIGMLSSLYRYATIAHIGNGFGSGIHNTLEAAVYGVPVIFGPNYHKFQEAKDLIECGGGFSFTDKHQYEQICSKLLNDAAERQKAAEAARNYVSGNSGASSLITDFIKLQ
jgi:3-deoxy-D-manno-octulosonic-acid transferase